MSVLNINVGLLGHVDSGKTSLAKALSVTSSTACFDKNPQSQERGITIDLGFSSFTIEATPQLQPFKSVQFTLVDCPGHASLIRTIIGGAQIIDIMILVVDVTKGVQTQTAECLIIGQIMHKPLVVVLNKVDLLPEAKRHDMIEKMKKKLNLTLTSLGFNSCPIVPISAQPGGSENSSIPEGLSNLTDALRGIAVIPERFPDKPLILSVDHCFSIKGKGTVLTGTILQGTIKINDNIDIPELQMTKKVKSIQIFRQNVESAVQGDRVGVCVTQFDPKLLERGLACAPGHLNHIYAFIIPLNRVKFYKFPITSKAKYHFTVGYNTVLGKATLFTAHSLTSEFSLGEEFEFIDTLGEEEELVYALIELERSIVSEENAFVIASKLDIDVNTSNCRIAFYGNIIHPVTDRNYTVNFLPQLKIFKQKQKTGVIQRFVNDNEVIAESIFKKTTKMQSFTNMKVQLETGETGFIESTFGQGGKVKVRIPDGLKQETITLLPKAGNKGKGRESSVKLFLNFKKYIYDKEKRIVQN